MLFDRIRQGFFALILVVAVVLGDDWLRTAAWALFAIVALAYLLTLYLTRDRAYAKPSPPPSGEKPRTLAQTVAAAARSFRRLTDPTLRTRPTIPRAIT